MTQPVDPTQIEDLVGAKRHPTKHQARADTVKQTVYILHSQECLDTGVPLTQCRYSLALDRGAEPWAWEGYEDRPVFVEPLETGLFPADEPLFPQTS